MWTSYQEEFNKFVKNIPTRNTLNYLKETLGVIGVKMVYEKDKKISSRENPVLKRIMLSSFNRSCKFKYVGVILGLENNKYRIISYQPKPPLNQFRRNNVVEVMNREQKQIRIIQATDGTTVTLYWLNNKWVISTHRGYEVNNLKWMGYTYQYLLDDVLSSYMNFSYDKLNKNKCYTIGFKHSFNHPFLEGKKDIKYIEKKAWFIQSIDINRFNLDTSSCVTYDEDIGLPLQRTVPFMDLRTLYIKANNAYNNYIKNGNVNYGYIICTKNSLKYF
tara:strand:- start:16 stop:840 length:825 start_codon:yes stop_codon:yes gene_type:complete